jgi:hypothetical protein
MHARRIVAFLGVAGLIEDSDGMRRSALTISWTRSAADAPHLPPFTQEFLIHPSMAASGFRHRGIYQLQMRAAASHDLGLDSSPISPRKGKE